MEILNMVVMEGLSERKTFMQRLEGGKGVSHGAIGKASRQGKQQVQRFAGTSMAYMLEEQPIS